MPMTAPLNSDFSDCLIRSQDADCAAKVSNILLAEIPGSVGVYLAAKANDRRGVDIWVEMSSGTHLAIDLKTRNADWAHTHPLEDDLALETWSVIEKEVVGWTRDTTKRCDYVLWFWKDTGRFCLIPFPSLCRAFTDHWQVWKVRYKTSVQRTAWSGGDYHSECIFVPRKVVWLAIYKRIGGVSDSLSRGVFL